MSRVIRDKSWQRQKRLDLVQGLEVWGLWGGDEDVWDSVTESSRKLRGRGDGGKGVEGRWEEEVEKSKRFIERELREQKKTWLETGRKMADIVWKEKGLAEKEKAERRNEKDRKRKLKLQGNVMAEPEL